MEPDAIVDLAANAAVAEAVAKEAIVLLRNRGNALPLAASANDKRFKAALLDIGLLQNLCQVPVDLELREDDLLSMYRGKLAEQFVAQELIANHASELFYWAREAAQKTMKALNIVVETQ